MMPVTIHLTASICATGSRKFTFPPPDNVHDHEIFTLGTPLYQRPGEVIFTPLIVLSALRVIVAVAVSSGPVILNVGREVQVPVKAICFT